MVVITAMAVTLELRLSPVWILNRDPVSQRQPASCRRPESSWARPHERLQTPCWAQASLSASWPAGSGASLHAPPTLHMYPRPEKAMMRCNATPHMQHRIQGLAEGIQVALLMNVLLDSLTLTCSPSRFVYRVASANSCSSRSGRALDKHADSIVAVMIARKGLTWHISADRALDRRRHLGGARCWDSILGALPFAPVRIHCHKDALSGGPCLHLCSQWGLHRRLGLGRSCLRVGCRALDMLR